MHIFPFLETSGKIGRAVMNLLLVRSGYLPAIIHATERQRYYEVLRQSQGGLTEVLVDSVMASLEAAARFLRRES
jgi:Fic family protein